MEFLDDNLNGQQNDSSSGDHEKFHDNSMVAELFIVTKNIP